MISYWQQIPTQRVVENTPYALPWVAGYLHNSSDFSISASLVRSGNISNLTISNGKLSFQAGTQPSNNAYRLILLTATRGKDIIKQYIRVEIMSVVVNDPQHASPIRFSNNKIVVDVPKVLTGTWTYGTYSVHAAPNASHGLVYIAGSFTASANTTSRNLGKAYGTGAIDSVNGVVTSVGREVNIARYLSGNFAGTGTFSGGGPVSASGRFQDNAPVTASGTFTDSDAPVSASGTFSDTATGTVTVPVGGHTYTGTVSVNVSGPVSVTGTANVSGPVSVSGSATVDGNVSVTGTASVTGTVQTSTPVNFNFNFNVPNIAIGILDESGDNVVARYSAPSTSRLLKFVGVYRIAL